MYDSRNNCNAIVESATNTLMFGCKNTIIPNSVTSIGRDAFSWCSGLTSISIPNSVTSIGYAAFSWCSGLTSITIPNSVTSIGEGAFYGCDVLTSITIPNSVTSIGDIAFAECCGLTSVIFNAENCNDLSNDVWTSDNLTSFTIGDKVQRIPAKLCYGLSKLTSIIIPNSVTSIGAYAFYGCSGLNLIRCDAVTPPSLGSNVFYKVDKSICKLVVPDQSIGLYKSAEQWKDFLDFSDVEMVTVDESGISVENGAIVNRSNQQIDVYSISGAKAYSGNDAEITLPSGIYVVKAGDKVVKLAL